ncbi:hypothetical protein Tco_0951257 [Tanacetum coccineum]|uniref:Uncharacterized protein n=1 Tax=Tanacetum coccineum TaxID=301880 RepID=A0ABQ5DVZ9_9ASTR
MWVVWYVMVEYALPHALGSVFGHVVNDCPKRIVLDVLKNLKNLRQLLKEFSEVDEVFNETACFMPSTSSKVGNYSNSGSGVESKSMYEQWREAYADDPYNDDKFDNCGLTDASLKRYGFFRNMIEGCSLPLVAGIVLYRHFNLMLLAVFNRGGRELERGVFGRQRNVRMRSDIAVRVECSDGKRIERDGDYVLERVIWKILGFGGLPVYFVDTTYG